MTSAGRCATRALGATLSLVLLTGTAAAHGGNGVRGPSVQTWAGLALLVAVALVGRTLLRRRGDDAGFVRLTSGLLTASLGATFVLPVLRVGPTGALGALAGVVTVGGVEYRRRGSLPHRLLAVAVLGAAVAVSGFGAPALTAFTALVAGVAVAVLLTEDAARHRVATLALLAVGVTVAVAVGRTDHAVVDAAFVTVGGALLAVGVALFPGE